MRDYTTSLFKDMPTTRIYYPEALTTAQKLTLSGEIAHYLLTVLRLKKGAEIILFYQNTEYHSRIINKTSRKSLTIQVITCQQKNRESPLHLHLYQAISRTDRMDLSIQKAVELGVSAITPIISEYSFVPNDKKRLEKRFQHWQKIIQSACEQSGRNTLPLLEKNLLFNTIPKQDTLALFFHPGKANTLQQIYQNYPSLQTLSLYIGAEGGLSATEIEQLQTKNFTAISLGSRILRTETATISAITAAQLYWGDLNS